MSERKVTELTTICPVRYCSGVMFNITSRLAESLGIVHLRCDKCKKTWAIDTKKTNRSTPRGSRR